MSHGECTSQDGAGLGPTWVWHDQTCGFHFSPPYPSIREAGGYSRITEQSCFFFFLFFPSKVQADQLTAVTCNLSTYSCQKPSSQRVGWHFCLSRYLLWVTKPRSRVLAEAQLSGFPAALPWQSALLSMWWHGGGAGSELIFRGYDHSCLPGDLSWVLVTKQGLPRWFSGKESTCQRRRLGFDPWVGKIPWRRKWQPTQVFLPGKSHGQSCLVGYSTWGCKESDTT